MSDAWLIGWAIGGVVVLLVVALLLVLIFSARRIAGQASEIRRGLDATRANTVGLWEIAPVNRQLIGTTGALRSAREQLREGP